VIALDFEEEVLEAQYQREIDIKDIKEAWETEYYLILFAVPTAAVNLWTYLVFILSPYGKISLPFNFMPITGIVTSGLWLLYSGFALLIAYIQIYKKYEGVNP
jgi:hypothetical protein